MRYYQWWSPKNVFDVFHKTDKDEFETDRSRNTVRVVGFSPVKHKELKIIDHNKMHPPIPSKHITPVLKIDRMSPEWQVADLAHIEDLAFDVHYVVKGNWCWNEKDTGGAVVTAVQPGHGRQLLPNNISKDNMWWQCWKVYNLSSVWNFTM